VQEDITWFIFQNGLGAILKPNKNCIVLSNVFTPTRKALEFKHASQ